MAARRAQERPTAHRRGYTRAWGEARKQYLVLHPWCVDCAALGIRERATDVDHVVAHKGNQDLFWSRTNWAGRCHVHHSQKTAAEDGGFGNQGKAMMAGCDSSGLPTSGRHPWNE